MVMSRRKIIENVNRLSEAEAKSLLTQVIQLTESINIQPTKSDDCLMINFYMKVYLEAYGFYECVSE